MNGMITENTFTSILLPLTPSNLLSFKRTMLKSN
jgi:hypothetical protein